MAFAASFERVFNAGGDACCTSCTDCDLVRSHRWSLFFFVSRSVSVLFRLPLCLVMRGGWMSVVLGCCVAVDCVVLCLVCCSLGCTLGSAFGCTLGAAWVCCVSCSVVGGCVCVCSLGSAGLLPLACCKRFAFVTSTSLWRLHTTWSVAVVSLPLSTWAQCDNARIILLTCVRVGLVICLCLKMDSIQQPVTTGVFDVA